MRQGQNLALITVRKGTAPRKIEHIKTIKKQELTDGKKTDEQVQEQVET